MGEEPSKSELAERALRRLKEIWDAAGGDPGDVLSQAEIEVVFAEAVIEGVIPPAEEG